MNPPFTPALRTALDAAAIFALFDPPSPAKRSADTHDRITQFARYLQNENKSLIFPAPALAEYLAFFPTDEPASIQLNLFQSRVEVAPFDTRASGAGRSFGGKLTVDEDDDDFDDDDDDSDLDSDVDD